MTVAIPVRNGAANIRACLDSVLQQTYQNFEIIVVDDGSTDDTARIVSEYGIADKRVHLIRQNNCGAGMARLSAFEAASGSLIATLDSDDLWLHTNLEKQVARILNADDSVGVVYSWSIDTGDDNKPTGGFHASSIEGDVFNSLLCCNFMANASSTLIRRDYLDLVVEYCKESWKNQIVQRCEEWELYLHLAKRCRFLCVPEFLVLYHQSESSMSRAYDLMAEAHELMLQRISRTYPDIASIFCSSSKANYYLHLAHQNSSCSSSHEALNWIYQAARAQLGVVLLRPDFYLLFAGIIFSLFRKLLGSEEEAVRRGRTVSISDFLQRYNIRVAAKLWQQNLMHQILRHFGSENSLLSEVAPIAIRTVELTSPVNDIEDVGMYSKVRIFVLRDTRPLGYIDFVNNYDSIAESVLTEALIAKFGADLCNSSKLSQKSRPSESSIPNQPSIPSETSRLSHTAQAVDIRTTLPRPSVSIVVSTYDRPEDLRHCLNSLVAQECSRSVEIIVVDNHPSSGLTPPVVAEFDGVKLVMEPRQGSSYARNAGIAVSKGEVIAVTDDDVQAPKCWLERLLSGFVRSDVMAVTGNALPGQLDYRSQQLFEAYSNGGLGHGFVGWEADSSWFQSRANLFSVPTWLLGGTANVAFRSKMFADRDIGLMHEALGAGMPSGGGEDLYLFYRILKAGYAIKYEPDAFVWHKHRRTMDGLRKQLFGYSKAYIAYQTTTFLSDGDCRAVFSLVPLVYWHTKRIIRTVTGRDGYPLGLIVLEIAGNLMGPIALLRSHMRRLKVGRSQPYIPVVGCFYQDGNVDKGRLPHVKAAPTELAGSRH